MNEPIRYRNKIPFYYDKSPKDFRLDPYERYDPMVMRQSMIHLCDELYKEYLFQPVLDYIENIISTVERQNVLEIGCGVGRMIGHLAHQLPNANCWGIDYSYQMLKQAHDVWLEGNCIELDLTRFGYPKLEIEQSQRTNLKFGLAKCEQLPFYDNSQDVVFSSFLIDRLTDPIAGLLEMKRVVRSDGKVIIISPMNFQKSEHWDKFYPIKNLKKSMRDIGYNLLQLKEDIIVEEPMDAHGNMIMWKCIGLVLQ